MVTQQIKLLVHLAISDGEFDPREESFIYSIGRGHGLDDRQIDSLINSPGEYELNANIPDEDKFEYLYSLVQLMKIDRQVFNQEVLFCQQIAEGLGFDYEVLFEMYPKIHPNLVVPKEKRELRRMALDHLRNKKHATA